MRATDNLYSDLMQELTNPIWFQWNRRHVYSKLAAKLGVDEETVRVRIKRFTQSGLIRGWQLIVNPWLFEMEEAILVFEHAHKPKKRILAQLASMDRLLFVLDFLDGGIMVVVCFEDERELAEKVDRIRSICGSTASTLLKRFNPPCDIDLRRTDWEILRALRKNPKMTLVQIAEESRLSARTVARELSRLIDGNAFHILPILDFKKSTGLNLCLVVLYSSEESKRSIDGLLLSRIKRLTYTETNLSRASIFGVFSQSLSATESIGEWIMNLSGVNKVISRILTDKVPAHDWMDLEITKRVRRSFSVSTIDLRSA